MYSLEPLEGSLGKNKAGHLLRRTTFGPTQKDMTDFSDMSASDAVDLLFQVQDEPAPPIDPKTGQDWVSPSPGPENSDEGTLWKHFIAWNVELMRNGPPNAREKITWFLHTHTPVSYAKVIWSTPAYYQNKLFRHYAFGSFKTMFKKLVIDNAMLWYLDNTLNYAESPNENFAREMFELYTIGKGPLLDPGDYTHYTEDDIKAAARVLTGYLVDVTFENYDQEIIDETTIAQGYVYTNEDDLALLHDAGVKSFSDKFQQTQIEPAEVISGYATREATLAELDELIDMIFNQEETARFIVRKMYRHFVYYKITDEIESEIIEPLAETFRENGYSIESVLKRLFKSKHFYDADKSEESDKHIGAIVKSPLELLVGAIKFFQLDFPTDLVNLYEQLYGKYLLNYFYVMGQPIYAPEDVAGYPAYFQEPGYNRNWITATNLAFRYYPVYAMIIGLVNEDNEVIFQLDIVDWVAKPENISNAGDPYDLVDDFTSGLFGTPLAEVRLNYFVEQVFMDGLPTSYWPVEWTKYQDGGEDTIVRSLIHRLLLGLMQSPEFQLF